MWDLSEFCHKFEFSLGPQNSMGKQRKLIAFLNFCDILYLHHGVKLKMPIFKKKKKNIKKYISPLSNQIF